MSGGWRKSERTDLMYTDFRPPSPQLPHKSVNLFFISVIVKNKVTILGKS